MHWVRVLAFSCVLSNRALKKWLSCFEMTQNRNMNLNLNYFAWLRFSCPCHPDDLTFSCYKTVLILRQLICHFFLSYLHQDALNLTYMLYNELLNIYFIRICNWRHFGQCLNFSHWGQLHCHKIFIGRRPEIFCLWFIKLLYDTFGSDFIQVTLFCCRDQIFWFCHK